jgi:lauroyl/myristoyl acyltransferase
MIRTGDPAEELQLNMRRVLDMLEEIIRRWPGQWQMFVPVWPELLQA